ncbi:cytochrome-c oxidase, cbb3-type subunit III [Alsobacter sp. KACC 23698]|uniref:Cbb3-type cytochrome c oxidase subunit n=1 Tax=Alsobacter sp. KACC 23698 TaxID=3149229 RepID=A0AAU7JC19_9HYPH
MAAENTKLDAVTGVATTGHDWDGIQELNTPLPRWWLWMFYACIVWGVGYVIAYPAWPLVSGYTRGVLGYQTRTAIEQDMAALTAMRGDTVAKLSAAPLADIEKDPKLLTVARALGKAAFGNNCAPCHGQGAQGAKNYPNLNDDQWIWGGSLEAIQQTILHGIRNEDPDSRMGPMPAFGKDGIIPKAEIPNLAAYVRTLAGNKPERGDAAKGQKLFAENCAACHGDAGKGNPEVGAPNLTANIWLYGGDQATLEETITNGRGGVMPTWASRLDPTTVKALTVYVHSLGGGQ